MAESLLLPVVRGVASKATSMLVQSLTSTCGVDDDRRKLERQLLAVQCKLADAEVKSYTNQYVKRWMKDFRAVAYEADNVLDDFQYEALRRKAQIDKSKAQKILDHFTNHSPLLFRFIMSRKLNNVLEKISKLVEEMNTFGLVENHVEVPPVLYRQTHAALDDSEEMFGRDDDKEVVVKLLLEQQDQRKVQVLPIFGMGGLGKTTLAKMVYNDLRVHQHFQLNMWHCVSENFEAVDLVRSIIELATRKTCNLPDTIELLRGRLQEVIGQKRFLLVLDDVWNEEKRKWEDEVKPLLCSIGGPGSVIVVTCRSQQVASIMGTQGPHKLACLSEDNSWKLFSKKAFSNGIVEQAELVTIGERIVKKCRGLPLSLKTMGGLLSSKQQVNEWEAIEESNIGDNVGGKDEILPILKLSYKHLSSEMKQCFAFCALFPKDYEMDKDKLTRLWMANGFIQEEGTMDLVQKGEFVFHYLVWRSFLQDVKTKVLYIEDTRYEAICCKMHDLMHDLAKHVTDECATIDELIQQKASLEDTRHMSIGRQFELKQSNRVLKGTTSLRTLLAPSTSHKNLMELKLFPLRALRYQDPSIIHSQVINAKHLRYLDLSGSPIVKLPNSICVLYNLQSLRLIGCAELEQLPEGITAMRELIHLYLFGCDHLERMPQNISLLKNLCTLSTFVVDTKSGRGIEELKDLCHLGNRLELYNLRKIKSVQNAKKANLHQKKNLSKLLLCWGRRKREETEDEAGNEEEVLESLAPHSKLQILKVHGYGGLEISQWMKDPRMFQCLTRLTVSNCPRCKGLPVVWLSDSLEYLRVENMGNLTALCKSTMVEAEGYNTHLQFFPKLKKLFLHQLPNLERWEENCSREHNNLLMFPWLESLEITLCPKFASVPGSLVLKTLLILGSCNIPSMPIFSLPSLVRLEIKLLKSMTIPNLPASIEKLDIYVCFNLVALPSNLGDLANLRDLNVQACNSLKVLYDGMDGFISLERLLILGSPAIEEFPQGPLKRLPALLSLCILGCPELQRRCRKGGEYFHLVSSIPYQKISPAEESF